MGLIDRLLAFKKIDKVSTFYSDHLALELSEFFHFHMRNLRLDLDDKEFESISRAFIKAYAKWLILGKPKLGDIENNGKQIFLSKSSIDAEAGKNNKVVNSDEMRVELQKWADYVHVHWKWIRMEFSVLEFLEFAKVINTAVVQLVEEVDLTAISKRTGKYHVACPRGRVDREDGRSWTKPGEDYLYLKHPHKTTYMGVNDQFKNMESEENINENLKSVSHSSYTKFVIKKIQRSAWLSKMLGIMIK